MNPFKQTRLNFLNVFNEAGGLIICYLLLPLQDVSYDPEERDTIGDFSYYCFFISGVINVTVIIGLGVLDFYKEQRIKYKMRKGIYKHCKGKPTMVDPAERKLK